MNAATKIFPVGTRLQGLLDGETVEWTVTAVEGDVMTITHTMLVGDYNMIWNGNAYRVPVTKKVVINQDGTYREV